MSLLDGSPESRMTEDELIREADERGDPLARALAAILAEQPTEAEREKEAEQLRVQSSYEGECDLWEKLEDSILAMVAVLALVSDDTLINQGMTKREVFTLRRDVIIAADAEPVDPSAPVAAAVESKAA